MRRDQNPDRACLSGSGLQPNGNFTPDSGHETTLTGESCRWALVDLLFNYDSDTMSPAAVIIAAEFFTVRLWIMTDNDREKWDSRYRKNPGGSDPSLILKAFLGLASCGSALDIA